MIKIREAQVPKINGADETDGIIELPYSSDENMEQGLTTADPEVILQTIRNLAPGERVIIRNVSRVRASVTEYYCRKAR